MSELNHTPGPWKVMYTTTMQIHQNEKGLFSIWNNGRQLTNVPFTKN